jgi:catechol 2,3-dioxygenase-like lactoylglutathione lyase family enzyme
MIYKVTVISLWAKDVPATAHFYRDVIGLRLLSHHNDRPHFDINGTYLTILKGTPIPAQSSEPEQFPLLAFAVDDLDKAIENLRNHDIQLPWDVEQDGNSRWIIFRDPAGNLIELVQYGEHTQSVEGGKTSI